MDELKNIRHSMMRMERGRNLNKNIINDSEYDVDICLNKYRITNLNKVFDLVGSIDGIVDIGIRNVNNGHKHLTGNILNGYGHSAITDEITDILSRDSREKLNLHLDSVRVG